MNWPSWRDSKADVSSVSPSSIRADEGQTLLNRFTEARLALSTQLIVQKLFIVFCVLHTVFKVGCLREYTYFFLFLCFQQVVGIENSSWRKEATVIWWCRAAAWRQWYQWKLFISAKCKTRKNTIKQHYPLSQPALTYGIFLQVPEHRLRKLT